MQEKKFKLINLEESSDQREKRILEFWKNNDVFAKREEQNKNQEKFVFYEGPPTTNGKPGIHHLLSRVFKDIYIRFHLSLGHTVPRKAGWDCHGLPVEREVEKKLNIKSKTQVAEEYGIDTFNKHCRESVKSYVKDWEDFSERMGFFVDYKNAYYTMDNAYIQSVWHLLKKIWDRGLIYKGYKVVPYDPVLESTVSDAELDQGYKEVEDPSIVVHFNIKANSLFTQQASFLVWTTTPWTLLSNVALAIAANEDYALLSVKNTENGTLQNCILASARIEEVKNLHPSADTIEYKVLDTFKGEKLLGLKYEPLFEYLDIPDDKQAFMVLPGDFVTMESGTGIVHIAPAYGADDLELAQLHDLPILFGVESNGKFIEGTPWENTFFKDADKDIIRNLQERSLIWSNKKYKHTYPFGYRTGVPILYYAKYVWYIRTTDIKNELIANNEEISWYPSHLKEGRFGNWLKNNRDWALSRERFWGTPLPIWQDEEGNVEMIASVEELEKLTGRELSELDLHRPYIDEIEFIHPRTKTKMRRVTEVIDCWFDSGAMPYAQWNYPLENQEQFKDYFPADFICEAIDQTRGWFYTLLAVGSLVSRQSPYKNVLCLGHVLDGKGEKMSKSKGNVVDPWTLFAEYGVDIIRWHFLTAAAPAQSRRIAKEKDQSAITQSNSFFNMFLNSLNFWLLYANIDSIQLKQERAPHEPYIEGDIPAFSQRVDIDQWILSELQELIDEVRAKLFLYDAQGAGQLLTGFLEKLSNWYIRRNRRRFWKGSLDQDKLAAFDTLYRCLFELNGLLYPFTPFLCEEVYKLLTNSDDSSSIILQDYPKSLKEHFYNKEKHSQGQVIHKIASLGRIARNQSAIKVRQPLKSIACFLEDNKEYEFLLRDKDILLEELNVKELHFIKDIEQEINYRIRLNLPKVGKRLGASLPKIRQHIEKSDSASLVKKIQEEGKIVIPLDEEKIAIHLDELLIERQTKEHTASAESAGAIVILDTHITEDLVYEGISREIIRHVQELRKTNHLELTDRINIYIHSLHKKIQETLEIFQSKIVAEVLGTFRENLIELEKEGAVIQEEIDIPIFNGPKAKVTLAIKKII